MERGASGERSPESENRCWDRVPHIQAPFGPCGQTVGLIGEVLSAAEIVRSIVAEAEKALRVTAMTSVPG